MQVLLKSKRLRVCLSVIVQPTSFWQSLIHFLLNFIKGVPLVLKAVILLFPFHCNLASASGNKQIIETDEQFLWRKLFYSSLIPMTSNLSWNNPKMFSDQNGHSFVASLPQTQATRCLMMLQHLTVCMWTFCAKLWKFSFNHSIERHLTKLS